MLYQFKRNLATYRFNFNVKKIGDLPPIHCNPQSSVTIVSQLRQSDVYMYLVAIHSFCQQIQPRKIVIINDGLTDSSQTLLRRTIKNIDIKEITSISTGNCPRGGTWERLLHIIDLSKDSYVIQLDADTLTLNNLEMVRDCIKANRSFTLGSEKDTPITNFMQASASAMHRISQSDHIQTYTEASFSLFENARTLHYIRGNSAFAGFSKGNHDRKIVEDFSARMIEILGKNLWYRWGTEQVASNVSIANAADATALDFPKYSYFSPDVDSSQAIFIHFMGSYRFNHGVYMQQARNLINTIQQKKEHALCYAHGLHH